MPIIVREFLTWEEMARVEVNAPDLPGILELKDFPVYARGITPVGPLHRGPGEINYPVSVGGIVVQPGDVIVGDLNGVVVVPRDSAALAVGADEVAAALQAECARLGVALNLVRNMPTTAVSANTT